MESRKITLPLNKIKFIGGLVFFILLLFFIFAMIEGEFLPQDEIANAPEIVASPTPLLEEIPEYLASVTPPPTAEEALPTSIPQALPTLSNITPYSLPEGINPLTGLSPSLPELLERRPIASKIALYPRYVRTINAGLSLSDVVFEYYIESGLTRFIAVFYGNDAERVGPVRSGRFFDEHVARMYQSYLVFKYADKRVFEHLKETDISDFLIVPGNSACPPFVIGRQDLDTYNNIFLNTTRFSDCLAKQGKDDTRPDLRAGYFSLLPPSSGEPALGIFARYSLDDYHYWEYQPLTQKYYRHQEANDLRSGKVPAYMPLMDALTGEQVTADNVVYIFVPHTFDDQYQEEDEVYHIDLIGLGKAYLFRDGIVFPAYWRRVDSDQPLLITDPSGMPLSLKPGRTFYQVLGENSSFTDKNNLWYFQFETP